MKILPLWLLGFGVGFLGLSLHFESTQGTQESQFAERPPLRDQVREILRPACGSCHTSTLTTARPGAIAVFDLAKEEWSESMSADQLEGMLKRTQELDTLQRAAVERYAEQKLQSVPATSAWEK